LADHHSNHSRSSPNSIARLSPLTIINSPNSIKPTPIYSSTGISSPLSFTNRNGRQSPDNSVFSDGDAFSSPNSSSKLSPIYTNRGRTSTGNSSFTSVNGRRSADNSVNISGRRSADNSVNMSGRRSADNLVNISGRRSADNSVNSASTANSQVSSSSNSLRTLWLDGTNPFPQCKSRRELVVQMSKLESNGMDESYDLDRDGQVGQEDYRLSKHLDVQRKGYLTLHTQV
jgi:hypothetical protein